MRKRKIVSPTQQQREKKDHSHAPASSRGRRRQGLIGKREGESFSRGRVGKEIRSRTQRGRKKEKEILLDT